MKIKLKKIIFLVLLCISCNEKPKEEDYCVKKTLYASQLRMLVPESAIEVYIEDKKHILRDKYPLDKLRKVLFYSIKKEDRDYFHLISAQVRPFKIEKGIIDIPILTAYFRPNIFIHGIKRENKWSPDQIQEVLSGDIGLVFDKDTVRVKACDKQQFIMIYD